MIISSAYLQMDTLIAFSRAFALEGAFHYVELTLEAVRRNGITLLRPEVVPFRSMPLCEALASSAAALALVFHVEAAWQVFDYTMALHIATYLWVETGIDAVAVAFLLFMAPEVTRYALSANVLMVILMTLQPRRTIPRPLWQHAFFIAFLGAARLLVVQGYDVAATISLGVAVEISVEAFRQRMYGPILSAPDHVSCGLKTIMWMLIGVRLVDAQAWLRWKPAMHSGLPSGVRGVRFFCNSMLIRGVRFYTGRVVASDTVAVSIGEWDEIAFAPNLCGFALALLASLRLPMSLRATINKENNALSETRLIFFFFELPSSWWNSLTNTYEQTEDTCMIKGATLLLPSRLTLRRITEALLSWMLLHRLEH